MGGGEGVTDVWPQMTSRPILHLLHDSITLYHPCMHDCLSSMFLFLNNDNIMRIREISGLMSICIQCVMIYRDDTKV